MIVRTRTSLTIAALAAGMLALTACDPNTTSTGTGNNAPTDGATTAGAKASSNAPAVAAVPNLVGKGLQVAQDTSQAAGFYHLTSHDSLGRDRMQLLDRDWQVCFQSPAAGTSTAVTTKVDFGAVKLTEQCPKTDERPPAKTGTMPDFTGKGLGAVRSSLPGGASITTEDATGDRMIILESNWKVCTQDPKAGVAYTGQPVTFTAVKTDETCP
ncbi:hypothetical protein [Streptomyces sp. NPDC049040]|uniref:hypothetical protein n=1 Tax=Streptomyces sp. NPDC049040 TaxID=3365593 RepID=UPI003713BBAD